MEPTDDDRIEIDRLLRRLKGRARRLSDSASDADDLAQEAALKLWAALDKGTEVEDTDRYAMTILRNLARERWRNGTATLPLEDDCAVVPPHVSGRLACADLAAAMKRLPARQAELLQLIAEGETSPAALAKLTGLPKGTVMSRLARARARLRAEMGMAQNAPVSELL